jgi:cell fate regulator YaaT (PSP1 superfamily)
MPRILAVKFSTLDMPKYFMPGAVDDARTDEFIVVPVEGDPMIGFVAAIEYRATEHLDLRPAPYPDTIRRATLDEVERWWESRAFERKALLESKERARALNLPIKVSTARYYDTSKRLVLHFTSETRVDFRTLVKDLAATLMVRVELWQVGIRDEARMLDGFGVCGQKTCCSTFLKEFKPISVRMARDQEINLPPTKLTGQCGRFLCCLSYEVDQYREMSREALPKGSTVRWGPKSGVVVDRNLIARTYLVRDETGSLVSVKADELGDAKVDVPEQMKKFGRALRENEASSSDTPSSDEAPPPRSDESSHGSFKRRPRNDSAGGRPDRSGKDRPARPQPPQQPKHQKRPMDMTEDIPSPLASHRAERLAAGIGPDADLPPVTGEGAEPSTPGPRRRRMRAPRKPNSEARREGGPPRPPASPKPSGEGASGEGKSEKGRPSGRRRKRRRGDGR